MPFLHNSTYHRLSKLLWWILNNQEDTVVFCVHIEFSLINKKLKSFESFDTYFFCQFRWKCRRNICIIAKRLLSIAFTMYKSAIFQSDLTFSINVWLYLTQWFLWASPWGNRLVELGGEGREKHGQWGIMGTVEIGNVVEGNVCD